MIVGLALVLGLASAGVMFARALGARGATTPASARGTKHDAPRGLKVGDVLLHPDGELWLAGKIELDEEGLVARLFRAPGAGRWHWVAQLDAKGEDLALLAPTQDVPAGSLPDSLPLGGTRLQLRKRGLARVSRAGEHLPPTTESARYVLLGGAGSRVLLVVDFEAGDRLALLGERVGNELLELLPGGDLDAGARQ